jgi:cold shock CspA family protein
MIGIVKKIDAQGVGIIVARDGSKFPFTASDVMNQKVLEPGQRITFSVRKVNDQVFAQNVMPMPISAA